MTRPARPSSARLLAVAAGLCLALAACGGTDGSDGTDGTDTADAAGLPTEEAPVTSGMCAADQPDCQDTIDTGICDPSGTPGCDEADDDPSSSGAAGSSCLAGDPDCTDESYDGQDVARPLPLSSDPSGAEPAERGATSGATGHRIEHAYLVDDDTLELTVGDNPCMLVEDVLVEESPEEVRVLVLAGQDASTGACIESYVQFTVQVDLAAPLGERTLLDLAG